MDFCMLFPFPFKGKQVSWPSWGYSDGGGGVFSLRAENCQPVLHCVSSQRVNIVRWIYTLFKGSEEQKKSPRKYRNESGTFWNDWVSESMPVGRFCSGTPNCASHGTAAITTNLHTLYIATGKGDYSRHQWHNGAIGIHHARSGAEGQPKWQGTVHSHKRLEAFSLIFSLLRMIERLVFGSLVMCSLQLLCLKDTSMRNLWELHFLCFITGSYTTKVSLLLPRERSNVLQQEASFCLSLMSVVWWSSQC